MSTPLRLSKLMADKGICSRREADHCIEQGWVSVNGDIMDVLGTKVSPEAEIKLSSDAEGWLSKKLTLIINKPVGVVSGQAEESYQPAISLVTEDYQEYHPGDKKAPNRTDRSSLAPVGRLDIDSRGLLLFTQDGKLARKIIGPESQVEKEYLVTVAGNITSEKIKQLEFGLSLDGKPLKRAIVKRYKDKQLQFILTEGKKRQIRRMCELVDLEIHSLVRTRIGTLKLGQLKRGHWRYLSKKEIFQLLKS